MAPLAAHDAIAPHLRLGTAVMAVTRAGIDKLTTRNREQTPFVLHLRHADGSDDVLLARAVIDASGTWSTPNPLGAAGVPAPGEQAAADAIVYGIPDVRGTQRDALRGQARADCGQRPLGVQRGAGSGRAGGRGSGHGDHLGRAAGRDGARPTAAARTMHSRHAARWASASARWSSRAWSA